MTISTFKLELARVFDDNLRTKQWHNYVDYAIIGLIIISTLEVFASTYDSIVERFGGILHIIDYTTTFIFTIEIILRIWCADLISDKYKGFCGRLRYCCSFYGIIDIISTFPFYLSFFVRIPYVALKALRIARLLRVFRYIKAFNILSRAMSSKKDEMVVSVQFLAIITLILSFILFFVEHEVQPEVYDNGWKSVVWAFAQYIGDPGNFADTPPITFVGRIIACIIGVLGIAIFAVPAGLIGSGFSEIMEVDARKGACKENIEKVRRAFERKLDRPTGYQIVPPVLSLVEIQARMGMTVDDIIDAVEHSDRFRLANTAVMQTVDEHPQDRLVVEHFVVNRPYGCCIDRGSKVTIVSPSNIVDPVIGHFGYYLAKIGGFNFVSRELGETRPYRSYYKFDDENAVEGLAEYMADLNRLTTHEDSWVITMLAASGGNEPSYPAKIEFTAGGEKGNESLEQEGMTVKDTARFKTLVDDAEVRLRSEFELESAFQRYHGIGINAHKLYTHKLVNAANINSFALLVAWSVSMWDPRRTAVAKCLAELIAKNIDGRTELSLSAELKRKDCGYDDYNE
ncbi:MAG: ion transporter [Alistipes sp.]|nr:ion transporter [Alistipes sp.]MBR3892227.1 ion transporter [Alistipes sp.]